MFRRSRAILPYALSGAAISILIAWLISDLRIGNHWGSDLRVTPQHVTWWKEHAPAGFAAEPGTANEHESLGVHTIGCAETWILGQSTSKYIQALSQWRVGFPWHSFEYETWHRSTGESGQVGTLNIGWREWPIRPVWSGLLLNAAFYSALLLIGFKVPRWLRGLRRLNRGRCARCAYPIGTSVVCTECGAALPEYARSGFSESLVPQLWKHRPLALIALVTSAGAVTTFVATLLIVMTVPIQNALHAAVNDPQDIEWITRSHDSPELDRLESVQRRTSIGHERLSMTTHGGVGNAGVMMQANVGGRTATVRYRAGWPMQAFEGIDWCGMAELPQPSHRVFSSADTLFVRRSPTPLAIPLRPMWPGFVVNTLLYSALIAVCLWFRAKAYPGRRSRTAIGA